MTKQQDDINFEISEEYKLMIDKMLEEEANGKAQYVSAEHIKNHFLNKCTNILIPKDTSNNSR